MEVGSGSVVVSLGRVVVGWGSVEVIKTVDPSLTEVYVISRVEVGIGSVVVSLGKVVVG